MFDLTMFDFNRSSFNHRETFLSLDKNIEQSLYQWSLIKLKL